MFKKETFMRIAETVAQESHAVNYKVGAVFVKDNRIVATGINGMPSGFNNKCEDENGTTRPEVTHAEINAIIFAAKSGIQLNGTDVYCTLSPCSACAAALSTLGIRNFYYRTTYRNTDGLSVLADLNIPAEKV